MNDIAKTKAAMQRNYGIDLLRLVAAFYVIILHTIYQGGLSAAVAPYSYQDYICRLFLIFSFCAVNIFGVISGYVGYRDPSKPASISGYLTLWLSVVFYGVVICCIYGIVLPGSVSWQDLVSMFFPLSRNLYWYFSAYTLVYFLAPYLNKFLNTVSERTARKCFFLICFVVVPLEYLKDTFAMSDGYSSCWLLTLYLVGAIMKKTGLGSRIPSIAAVAAIVILDLCFFKLNLRHPNVHFVIYDFSFEINYSYITPLYLASAIAHVLVFSRLRLPSVFRKMIAFSAPAAFFVYIVNVQDTFWKYFMKDRFISWASGSPASIFIRVSVFSFAFVIAVIFVDYFRQKLFRLIGVQKRIERMIQK